MKSATNDFSSISLTLASPDEMREWSSGEVLKAETINYRTGRSERGGLFDERIFGPTKDYECYCGKYRRVRYKNIICEKCGVEVTRSIVRRERMGHIELAAPVAHIWFLRGVPSRVGLLLNLSLADVEKVIYFAGYIVTKVDENERARLLRDLDAEYKTKLKAIKDKDEKSRLTEMRNEAAKEIEELREGIVLDEVRYHRSSVKYGSMFSAEIGAEAIYSIFKKLDLGKLCEQVEAECETASSTERVKIYKRLGLIKSMLRNNIRPEWMLLTVIPIMPPALRPMVPLDGGRHATSDVNDLYRRVINRNNRLKKLKDVGAPDVILRNEKRILQEAVDSLIDNAMRRGTAQPMATGQKRELKSLSENLKGKQGFFRQNLLGKRVDYSGRSVIVVGPHLQLDQCGLPKTMALELFRPFVISKLIEREFAYNIRGAGRLIEEGTPEVWAILEEVISDKYVLLNRAPTLHRLGIQAFRPMLTEGSAIELHPLVCPAFNADFDGDQMAVHVPLSKKAQEEAREIMASNRNILKPGSGDPTISSKMLDVVLGCFWVTKEISGKKGEDKFFSSPNVAITAHDFGVVDLRAKVKVLGTDTPKYQEFKGGVFDTTVGRLLFNSILPSDYPYINESVDRKLMSKIVDDLLEKEEFERVALILDKLKSFGFKYATKSGITWSFDDIRIPDEKEKLVEDALVEAQVVADQYNEGLLSKDEQYRKTIEMWQKVRMEIEDKMPGTLKKDGPVFDMLKSGARGQIGQITQMAGMKGLITNTVGRILSFPIISSYKEGLTPIEYFITTHGARYGLTATALQTARAGYLTRRLVDVAQDCIVTEKDCKDRTGKIMKTNVDISGIGVSLSKLIGGKFLLKDALDNKGKIIVTKGTLLKRAEVRAIEESEVEEVALRTPLSCKSMRGICQKCYGMDMGRGKLVEMGEAVGIVAAQAIGEPGTQLTMRTFHQGGVASEDITMGLPRVEEVFERRIPKNPAVVCKVDGKVLEVQKKGKDRSITILPEIADKKRKKDEDVSYAVPIGRTPIVEEGQDVTKGMLLTDGSANIAELFKAGGKDLTEDYIIHEISRIYDLQGESISKKHLEVVVRQMFSRRRIKSTGDTRFAVGDIVEYSDLVSENELTQKNGGEEAKAELVALGISEVALTTKSFLSAASFQNTTRVLIRAALRGTKDKLQGLKENVIIGRLVPAGTGYKKAEYKNEQQKED
jgi:DNA-directed RNA polymerase subunit beta'